MEITVKGVILSATDVGEYDRFMSVLTAEYGKISVYGSNVRRLKSKNFSSSQLYSYSSFVLSEKGDRYMIKESSLIDSFYGLRKNIESLALAGYVSEVASDISVEGENSESLLRLVLNTFYLISEEKKPLKLIKGTFELRAASEAGFAPDLVACQGCGKYNLTVYYFDANAGTFFCENCFGHKNLEFENELRKADENQGIYSGSRLILILSPDVYLAMRYVVFSKPEKLFSFELKDNALDDFASVCEKYLLCHTEKGYRTLDFYKSVVI